MKKLLSFNVCPIISNLNFLGLEQTKYHKTQCLAFSKIKYLPGD